MLLDISGLVSLVLVKGNREGREGLESVCEVEFITILAYEECVWRAKGEGRP